MKQRKKMWQWNEREKVFSADNLLNFVVFSGSFAVNQKGLFMMFESCAASLSCWIQRDIHNLKLVFFSYFSARFPAESTVVEKYVCTYMRTWKLCSLSCSPIEKFMMIRIYNRPTLFVVNAFAESAADTKKNILKRFHSLPSHAKEEGWLELSVLSDVFYVKSEWKGNLQKCK